MEQPMIHVRLLLFLGSNMLRALGRWELAYAFFFLGHVVMLKLGYWENCGSLGRNGKGD